MRGGLAVVDEPLLDRLAWRRGNPRGRLPSAPRSLLCLRRADRPGEPQRGQLDRATTSAFQSSSPAAKFNGGGNAGQAQPASLARAIDEVDLEARLHAHAILGADLPQEREGLVVAPEHARAGRCRRARRSADR